MFEVEKDYLTDIELNKLLQKEFSTLRLTQIRDVFAFCCFTGLEDKKQRGEKDGNRLIFSANCPFVSLSAE